MTTFWKIVLGVGCGVLLAVAALFVGCTALVGYGASKVEEEKSAKLAGMSVDVGDFTEEHGYFKVAGTVKNSGARAVTYVKVTVDFLDSGGAVVDNGWTYAVDSSPLGPGETRVFELSQAARPGVTRVSARIMTD
jgi:hypothetical protein